MKRVLLLVAALAFLSTSETKAQDYKHALGGRFGTANGLTFKTFVSGNRAWDLILNFRDNRNYSSFRFTGLYEIHNPINGAPGLNWYYGVGGTVGTFKWKDDDDNNVYLSADGVLGLDYKFNGAPINLALDWKPAIELTPNTEFDAEGVGLSVRFTF
jgi:hypothetical protein